MDKRVVIALAGGQDAAPYLRLLSAVAAAEGSAFGYFAPTPTSRAGCAEIVYATIGQQSACKEFLPETADVVLALEELEGRRVTRFATKEARWIVCACHRLPMAVAVGTTGYPTDILYRLVNEGRHVWQIKRTEMKECVIASALLRAMGYEPERVEAFLAAADIEADASAIALAFAKEDSK